MGVIMKSFLLLFYHPFNNFRWYRKLIGGHWELWLLYEHYQYWNKWVDQDSFYFYEEQRQRVVKQENWPLRWWDLK
jgi:hypothetical protein